MAIHQFNIVELAAGSSPLWSPGGKYLIFNGLCAGRGDYFWHRPLDQWAEFSSVSPESDRFTPSRTASSNPTSVCLTLRSAAALDPRL